MLLVYNKHFLSYFYFAWGLGAGLDGCGKSHPPAGFDPRTTHPVACRYTDHSILIRVNRN